MSRWLPPAVFLCVILAMAWALRCESRRAIPESPPRPFQPGLWDGDCDELVRSAAIGCAWPSGTQVPLFGDRECSNSPDVAPACCAQHDNDYAVGGTEQDRLVADLELAWCMALYGVDERIVWTYYRAVREFGRSSWHYDEHRSRGPPGRPGPDSWRDSE